MEDKVVYEPKLLPTPPTPTILSFYKVTKEVISEREKEKRMCVVAGGERQSVQIDFGESGKGRSCLQRVEFLDIIDALVEVCYHRKLFSMCVFPSPLFICFFFPPSPLVGPISQNLYKIQNIGQNNENYAGLAFCLTRYGMNRQKRKRIQVIDQRVIEMMNCAL